MPEIRFGGDELYAHILLAVTRAVDGDDAALHGLRGVVVDQDQRLPYEHDFFEMKQGSMPVHGLGGRLRTKLFTRVFFSVDRQRHIERYPQRPASFFAAKVKQGHLCEDLKSGFSIRGAFDQPSLTGLRLPCRTSRTLKRQNKRRDVTSTNLAHTTQYCRTTYFKTMAERYHKTPFWNSTPVLTLFSALWSSFGRRRGTVLLSVTHSSWPYKLLILEELRTSTPESSKCLVKW